MADRGDHARPRARLAGARASPGRSRSGRARASGARSSSARGSARRRASSSRSPTPRATRLLRDDYHLDELAARNLLDVPARAGAATRRRADRPHDRRRAVPRRDRRLARLHPDPVRRARARAVVDGARRPGSATRSGSRCSRSGRTTGSRSTSPTPTSPPPVADLLVDAGRARGPRRPGGRADGALRRALPRERRARAPHPAAAAGAAHAALAAAPEGAEPAPGRAPLRLVPDRARDLPRVPAGRLRPARAARRSCTGSRPAELDLVEVETRVRLADRRVAAVRLRGDLHVRGRHARRGAARAGALARPRPAPRAARSARSCASCSTRARSRRSRRRSGRAPRNADELHDLLRRGRRPRAGRARRGLRRDAVRERRAFRVRLGGEERADRRRGRRPATATRSA